MVPGSFAIEPAYYKGDYIRYADFPIPAKNLMMELIPSFYQDLMLIPWFSECGGMSSLPQGIQSAPSLDEALKSLNSPFWADVRTEAQGDLTGYLAKHHYTTYGVSWNRLAKESRSRLDKHLKPLLQSTLEGAGMPDITKDVLLDINRAALEYAYGSHFSKMPRFFERLLSVYRSGHLPCGWSGRIKVWPQGEIVAY